MTVSVIIPTLTGGLSHLVKLIPLLSEEPDMEMIVIDNNSRDGTANYLANYECLIKVNKTCHSFAESNNLGARYATGEYLLFLNNDTAIDPGFIQRMVGTFSNDDKIAAVGCQIRLMNDKSKVQHCGVMFNDNYEPYELGLAHPSGAPEIQPSDPRVTAIREVPAVTAACMMVKKDAYWEVGGFDEEYRNSWEDMDLNLKLREKGYKIWYNGQAKIWHLHFGSKDRGRFSNEALNRARYDKVWRDSGRAKEILGSFKVA